ncbi:MAG: inorganic diphosphatase [Erysipelotrichales bacterium]|nr:inorganic diphosphatase [Erysipelotrichales bacterium]
MNNVINAIVEITHGSKNKYEIDKKTGRIRLDRVLSTSTVYPAEYGIVENTLASDGDPLDIVILSNEKTYPGCVVPARVLGYLDMIDNGALDYKLIAVVDVDPRFNGINELRDLSEVTLSEIKNFFENYKSLDNIKVEVGEYHSKEEALLLIEECKEAYQEL